MKLINFLCNVGIVLLLMCSLTWAQSNEDCLKCHNNKELIKPMPDLMSMYVDGKKFNASVHVQQDLGCTDCHTGIKDLKKGKQAHASMLPKVDCSQCHSDEVDAYKQSAHAEAKKRGDGSMASKISPLCATCHDYHYTEGMKIDPLIKGENARCTTCHDPEKSHNWLPEKQLHMKYIECLVCHAPKAEKNIILSLYDVKTKKRIDTGKMFKKFGIDSDNFMKKINPDNDKKITIKEFDKFVEDLKVQHVKTDFWGEMTVNSGSDLHMMVTDQKLKDCKVCHSSDSTFFQNVSLSLMMPDGKTYNYKVDKNVLGSAYVSHFYAPEVTNTTLIDILGAILIIAVVLVVLGHGFLRIITTRMRKNKK